MLFRSAAADPADLDRGAAYPADDPVPTLSEATHRRGFSELSASEVKF